MKKLTIRKTSHKIWLGISILIVAYCMTIVASFVSKRIIRRNAMSINQASQKAIVLGQDFLSDLNKQMQLYQNAVVASELSMLDEAEKYRQSCMDILDALEGIEHTGSPTVGRIRALRNKIDRYGKDARRIYTSIIELEESGDVFASEDIYEKSQELAERRKRLLSESSQLTIATSKDLTDATNRIMATSERKKWFEVATLVIVLIVSLMIVTFVIRRFITKPIGQMTDAIEAMANGDFDINIEHESSDEIGRMADSMRIMVGAQKEKIAFAKSISEGDLGVRLKSRSEKDVLAKVFHSMIDSLNVKAKVAESIAKGDLNQNIQIVSDKDKFGKYFQSMVDNLREVVQQANVIAGGDYTSDIAPRSQEDELGYALQKMTQSLREMAERNERQVWLKTGESELSEKLRGDPEIGLLCQNAINFLAHYLGAQIGSLYVFDEDRGVLKLTGRYALDMDNHLNETIQIGQGLVGQAILEKRMLVTTDIPEDYGRIKSAHGAAPPRNIVVVPVIHEDKLSGALELGSFKEFSDRALDFLDLVMENLSIALHSAQSREKMKKLLQETKRQSDALHQQKDALKKSNKELEAQTLMLKRSEEQLKEQREELQATNEELERRTIDLEEQKTQMGKRNIELEVARNELEQKTKELEVTSKYKSEFLANMSHELRTPLNSLLILSRDLAENREGTLSEEQIESAKIIHKSGNDLLSLINDILDLSKVEAGKMPVHIETVHLKDIADNISMQFKPVIDEKGLEFNINLNSEIRPTIKTDQQRVEQIIKNLVSNASKFTDKGSITVDFRRADRDVELVESGLSPHETLAVSVMDTGMGIPEGKQREIFHAFRQADGSTSRKYGGTGLGLSISREFAKILGGEIQLTSEKGKGSTFTLFLPFEFGENVGDERSETETAISMTICDAEEVSEKIEGPYITDDRGHLKEEEGIVLVIEDDKEFAKILMDQCHEKGFHCLATASGEEGLELAEKYMPDAVILDVNLEGINGWTVLNRLKENMKTRHIPVHMMTVEKEGTTDHKQLGALSYLVKPITKEQLETAFNEIEGFVGRGMKRLLIVEDDRGMRTTIKNVIQSDDVEIQEADSGVSAIKALKSTEFDCMVLDLGLPDMSGLELLKTIEEYTDVVVPRVVVYTGKSLTREEERELRRYSQAIVIKADQSEKQLLDETALFMHRVVASMPKVKQEMIAEVRNTEHVLKDKKILVVDDDMRNVFALAKQLKHKGIKVFKAENGKKALEIMEREPDMDLVLMDIMMPVMDGFEATRRIRAQERFSKLPIITLTAKAMKGDRERCMDVGATDYLTKPVDMDRLFSVMRMWLYRPQAA